MNDNTTQSQNSFAQQPPGHKAILSIKPEGVRAHLRLVAGALSPALAEPKPLTPRDVADLTEEIVAACDFNDVALAALACIAREFLNAFSDSARVENLAVAMLDRSYLLTAHSGGACDAYVTEAREMLDAALAHMRARGR